VFLVLPSTGPLKTEADRAGIKNAIVQFPYPSRRPAKAMEFLLTIGKAAKNIRALQQEFSPDIVHYNTGACLAPALALRKSKSQRVWHLRERVPGIMLMEKIFGKWSDAVIANCQHTAEGYPRLLQNNRISVIHNGINQLEISRASAEAVRAKHGWSAEVPLLLFAGNLQPHKDPEAMIKLALNLRRGTDKFHICILGDGPQEGSLRRQISANKLESMVTMPGFVPNATDYVAAADTVVIPSRVEPFPRIGLEAMSLSKPIIASNVGGMAEQTIDGKTGILVTAGDDVAFASAASKLLQDKNLRVSLGEEAHRRFQQNFGSKTYCGGVTGLFESLLSEPVE
jgi:glycosyltransferase involved in cell wall biosynthesis